MHSHQPTVTPLDVKLLIAFAEQLRNADPNIRADAAEALVRNLGNLGFSLETLIPAGVMGNARMLNMPTTKAPLNEKNWMSFVRFLLRSPIIDNRERRFLQSIQARNSLSYRQKHYLWNILRSVYPAGCGNWGKEPPRF
jgi:hypothetical protein